MNNKELVSQSLINLVAACREAMGAGCVGYASWRQTVIDRAFALADAINEGAKQDVADKPMDGEILTAPKDEVAEALDDLAAIGSLWAKSRANGEGTFVLRNSLLNAALDALFLYEHPAVLVDAGFGAKGDGDQPSGTQPDGPDYWHRLVDAELARTQAYRAGRRAGLEVMVGLARTELSKINAHLDRMFMECGRPSKDKAEDVDREIDQGKREAGDAADSFRATLETAWDEMQRKSDWPDVQIVCGSRTSRLVLKDYYLEHGAKYVVMNGEECVALDSLPKRGLWMAHRSEPLSTAEQQVDAIMRSPRLA